MQAHLSVVGTGHAVGSKVVSNVDLAKSLGLQDDWFTTRTGTLERHVCAPGEDVLTLAGAAVQSALDDAGLDPKRLSHETLLLHIQNGFTALAPPPGILLAERLGMTSVRVTTINGVCAEPVAALEHAVLMLNNNLCDRVIICAAVDLIPCVRPDDLTTAALFGSGAGCMILERNASYGMAVRLLGLHWQTHAKYSRLGYVPVHGYEQKPDGFNICAGYYDMDGHGLARVGVHILPKVATEILNEAGWTRSDVQVFLAHQPNVRLLEIALRALELEHCVTPMPVKHLGNMGPASLFVNFSKAREDRLLEPGTKVLWMAFGLGFSCGGAALQF